MKNEERQVVKRLYNPSFLFLLQFISGANDNKPY